MPLEFAQSTQSNEELIDNLSTVLKQVTRGKVKAEFNANSLDIFTNYLNHHFGLTLSDEKLTSRNVLETLHDYSSHAHMRDIVEPLNNYDLKQQDRDSFIEKFKKDDKSDRRSTIGHSILFGAMTVCFVGITAGLASLGSALVLLPALLTILVGVVTHIMVSEARNKTPKTRDQRAKQAFNNHIAHSVAAFEGLEESFEFDRTNKKLSMKMLTL